MSECLLENACLYVCLILSMHDIVSRIIMFIFSSKFEYIASTILSLRDSKMALLWIKQAQA
jgi:hypothetical protein